MTRFSGDVGKEYDLFALSCPHINEAEDKIGEVISQYFQKRSSKGRDCIEAGCGTGTTTKRILEADPNILLTAIDNEEVMIQQAKENLNNYSQRGRLRIVHCDILEYLHTQATNSLDCFASGFMLHNLTKETRYDVLNEVYRTLKPGGLFVNGDKYARSSAQHKKDLSWQISQFKVFEDMGKPELAIEWKEHYEVDNQPEIIMREKESIEDMQRIGFKDIEVVYRKRMEAVVKGVKK